MSNRRFEADRRQRRKEAGVCVVCGKDRGESTVLSCRPCADKANHRMIKNRHNYSPESPRNSDGYVLLTCENCFKHFPWKGSGQKTMCDSCVPWFEQDETSSIDHAREQEQARKVQAFNPRRVLNDWQRQV